VSSDRNESGLPNIGRTLVSARSFDEYIAMFALTDADLAGSILDCPGGAASFTAEARAAGQSVTAVDPVYAADPEWLAAHAVEDAVRGNRHTGSSVESFVWTFFADIDDHLQKRTRSAQLFGADLPAALAIRRVLIRPRPELASALHVCRPTRPAFHIAAAKEMARVAAHEVRIFPLIADEGVDTARLVEAVRGALLDADYPTSIRPAPYEFQRGGNEMLVIDADVQ
jgi:hypothetical protein